MISLYQLMRDFTDAEGQVHWAAAQAELNRLVEALSTPMPETYKKVSPALAFEIATRVQTEIYMMPTCDAAFVPVEDYTTFLDHLNESI